jgi:hypothetical protein
MARVVARVKQVSCLEKTEQAWKDHCMLDARTFGLIRAVP